MKTLVQRSCSKLCSQISWISLSTVKLLVYNALGMMSVGCLYNALFCVFVPAVLCLADSPVFVVFLASNSKEVNIFKVITHLIVKYTNFNSQALSTLLNFFSFLSHQFNTNVLSPFRHHLIDRIHERSFRVQNRIHETQKEIPVNISNYIFFKW